MTVYYMNALTKAVFDAMPDQQIDGEVRVEHLMPNDKIYGVADEDAADFEERLHESYDKLRASASWCDAD